MKKCCVCLEQRQLQFHHIHPIEYGGDIDGQQIEICATCHLAVHHTAEGIMSKKGLTKAYLSEEHLLRAQNLIWAIINAKNDCQSNPHQLRRIILNVKNSLLIKAHKRKLDRGFTNLEKYVISLIEKDTSIL